MGLSVEGLSEMSVRGRGEADDFLERPSGHDQPRSTFPSDTIFSDAV